MFTAEEIENFDIFPKQYTFSCILKGTFYLIVMIISIILMYSFYSGRDFVSIITLESLAYSDSSYFIERLASLEPKNFYSNYNRYHLNYTDNLEKGFMLNYMNDNFPCLIKDSVSGFKVNELYNAFINIITKDNDTNPIYVEKRTDPYLEFYKKGFTYNEMNYTEFKTVSSTDERINYVINDMDIEIIKKNISSQLFENTIKSPLLTKYLKLFGIFYTEAKDKMVVGGHTEPTENILCMVKGETEILMVPAIERKFVYPYKKEYGPSNYSPISFFNPDFGRFPLFKKANRVHVIINEGDCIYIPSLWWRSHQSNHGKSFAYLTMKFESPSRYVDQIFKGINIGSFN